MKKLTYLIAGLLFFTLIAVIAFYKINNSKKKSAIVKPQLTKVSVNTVDLLYFFNRFLKLHLGENCGTL